jgi:broad specificity phosphatase PhoE
MRFTFIAATVFALLLSACATQPASTTQTGAQKAAEAIEALRSGGYVMVVRHGATDPTEADVDPLHLENCSKQRMLTDTGRLMASGIGKLLAREAVPVGEVRASRYCRAIETAKRIAEPLRIDKVAATDDFTEGGQVVSPKENARRTKAMREAVSTAPAAGTNSLIVSHRPNIMEAFGPSLFDITEGEMVVFKPGIGEPGYKVMWRIKVADFSAYASAQRAQAPVAVATQAN